MSGKRVGGKVYVVGDNIDTDQIIPGQYLSLIPTIREEYIRLGGYALCGLPVDQYPKRLVEPGRAPSEYSVLIAGRNFGCGSSREHAPIALGAAGIRVVIAESFARIFFRNCLATGELYPIESAYRLYDAFETGDCVEVDLQSWGLGAADSSCIYPLKPLGEAEKIVSAGGLFAYARKTGLVRGGNASS
ncbi:MAG: 3-isopropylmalate dehydratase [Phycisphaerales bacterium]|nr:MAG: 3-isopropylmalate dehydratase [Phycisphaerales bacterium]